MQKIIGLGVLVVVLIAGFFFWKQKSEPIDEAAIPANMMAETTPEKGMVSSIKEAMGLGQKMQCTYVLNESGESVESKVSIDGEKYRLTTVVGGMQVDTLFDGENQYSWNSATRTGMKMSKACLEKMGEAVKDMPEPAGDVPVPAEPKDMEKAFDMAKNVKCEPAPDIVLSWPRDIVFTDQCALMEQSMQMMEEIKEKLPAGMPMPDMSQIMAQ